MQGFVATMPSGVVRYLATAGPLGKSMPAPGTVGSMVGLIYTLILASASSSFGYVLFGALGLYFAVLVCNEAENLFQKKDPGYVILDEIAVIPICYFGVPFREMLLPEAMGTIILGFILFRIFDIWKPFAIDRLQRIKGGLGVVADDVAAATAACLGIHILRNLFGG